MQSVHGMSGDGTTYIYLKKIAHKCRAIVLSKADAEINYFSHKIFVLLWFCVALIFYKIKGGVCSFKNALTYSTYKLLASL